MGNKKITRKELYDYISNLEKLLFYSSNKTLDYKISSQLASKHLPLRYKSILAKNNTLLLYSKETETETLYNRLRDKFFKD